VDDGVLIEARDITKIYQMGDVEVRALRGASLQVSPGELVAIMGPSGSGKSTLMNILGCLDQPTSGEYFLEGVEIDQLDDNRLAEIRARKIGFVFQTFNLLARTTALTNVELPLVYSGLGGRRRRERAVAIARALINEPSIILADEPTGNLDSKSGAEIMAIFQRLNEEQGITIIFVTHEPEIAQHTRRIVRLADGRIVDDRPVRDQRRAGERAYDVRVRDIVNRDRESDQVE
jgi:putative ABC transport system ATP-binding protein